MRYQDLLEPIFRSGRGTGQDYGAGSKCAFDGEGGAAVPAVEHHSAGGDEEDVEGRVAVSRVDEGGVGIGGVAVGFDCVGVVEGGGREEWVGDIVEVASSILESLHWRGMTGSLIGWCWS